MSASQPWSLKSLQRKLLPDDYDDIDIGSFLANAPSYLSKLDDLPDLNPSALLNWAASLLDTKNVRFFSYAAMAIAYIANRDHGAEHKSKIEGLFDKLDERFRIGYDAATGTELAILRYAEFEVFCAAGSLLAFDKCFSHRTHGKICMMLNRLAQYDYVTYGNYIVWAANATHSDPLRNINSLLLANFYSIMSAYDSSINKAAPAEKIQLIVQKLEISGNTALHFCPGSKFEKPAIQHFSSAYDTLYVAQPHMAKSTLRGIRKILQKKGVSPNPAFVAIVEEKAKALSWKALPKVALCITQDNVFENSGLARARMIKKAWSRRNAASGSVARPH